MKLQGINDSEERHALMLVEVHSKLPLKSSFSLFIPQYLLQEGIDKTNSHLGVKDLMILLWGVFLVPEGGEWLLFIFVTSATCTLSGTVGVQ